jgi:hypothetical protein
MFGLKKRADGPTLLMTCRPIGFGGLSHGGRDRLPWCPPVQSRVWVAERVREEGPQLREDCPSPRVVLRRPPSNTTAGGAALPPDPTA